MQYLYGKVDTKMNEVFEMVAEVLEELRSEAGEREYSVCTKEAENAAKELKKANQEYEKLLAEIPRETGWKAYRQADHPVLSRIIQK